jgi:hypothetical protein
MNAHRKDLTAKTATMEHRHYATIAAIIRDLPEAMKPSVALHFARELRATNPRFQADRFYAACMA